MWDATDNHPRLLLVEDAPFLRYAFVRLLKMHGFEVLAVNDGREALDCVNDFHPQLVVTDLMMPGMDGLELIRKLRANPRTADLPVLAISADTSRNTEQSAREAGAVDFVSKPIDMPTLLDRLRAIPV
jgi:putative two-component system response regulator